MNVAPCAKGLERHGKLRGLRCLVDRGQIKKVGVQGKSAVNSTRSVSCYWLSGDWIR